MRLDPDEALPRLQIPYPSFHRIDIPANTPPLVRVLVERCNALKMPMTEVARRAGLDKDTIVKWRKTTKPTVENLEAALNVVGLRLAVVPLERPE